MEIIGSNDATGKMAKGAFAVILMFASCFANAAFVLTNSNGDAGVFQDNGIEDWNANLGVVLVNPIIDVWDVNVITGITKPIVGGLQQANIDLNSVNLASSGAAQPLAIFFGDDSFSASGSTRFQSEIGGTVQNADLSWRTCINASNAIACTSGPGGSYVDGGAFIGEGSFSDSSSFSVPLSGDYFMGLLAIITPNSGLPVLVSFDYQVTQVPIPAAAWLFGSALLGLFALKRQKA